MRYGIAPLAETREEVVLSLADRIESFDTFFRREYIALITFLRRLGFDREDAEDATQEAMACAFERWRTITNARGWVRSAAYRIALRHERRRRDGRSKAMAVWVMSRRADNEQIDAVDENLRIIGLLRGLPPQQRLTMTWYLDGFGIGEIAEYMDVNQATVRSNLRHARKRLKELLEHPDRDEMNLRAAREVPDIE